MTKLPDRGRRRERKMHAGDIRLVFTSCCPRGKRIKIDPRELAVIGMPMCSRCERALKMEDFVLILESVQTPLPSSERRSKTKTRE